MKGSERIKALARPSNNSWDLKMIFFFKEGSNPFFARVKDEMFWKYLMWKVFRGLSKKLCSASCLPSPLFVTLSAIEPNLRKNVSCITWE